MPATNSKPTSEELDQANQIYNDVNDYLEYLSEIIQSNIDSDDDDDEEELSPIVTQFLQEYKEYATSSIQLSDSDSSYGSSVKNRRNSQLPKRFLKYSKTFQELQLPSPDLLCDQKLCETKLDCNIQVSPLFSTSFSALDDDRNENEKLLTYGTSPSVSLLKTQLDKDTREREKNYMIVRSPIYVPVEEKKFVFVVKKSTDVIVAPPAVEPPKEPVKEETEENNNSTIENEKTEEIFSGKEAKNNTIDRDFFSTFLTIAKVGFSRSQLNSLVWSSPS